MRTRVVDAAAFMAVSLSLVAGSARATPQAATFTSQPYPFLGNTHIAADLNHDGKPDLVGNGAAVDVMLNTGNGAFAPIVPYPVAGASQDVAAADFNSDGHIDLAVTINTAPISLSLLMGNGNGTFIPSIDLPSTTGADSPCVIATDLNNDNKPDLVISHELACFAPPCVASQKLSVLRGNGNGTFQTLPDITVGTGMHRLTDGDFNRDGVKDLAICGDNTRLYILLGVPPGNGTFAQQPTIFLVPGGDLFSASGDVDVADFNGDEIQDLTVALPGNGRGTAIVIGNGDGTFQPAFRILENASYAPQSLAVADYNRDGFPDIARAMGDGTNGLFEILHGNGNATFQPAVHYLVPPPLSSIGGGVLASGDFNSDSKPDLALAVFGASPSLRVVFNTTNANLCPADIVSTGASANRVDVNDLLAVITQWGPCPAPPAACPANIATTGSSSVDVNDLLAVITTWGPCP